MSLGPKFIPFYPSDWLAGTRVLSASETGVYITLIAMMYEHASPLNMDDTRLARLCGSPLRNFTRALDRLVSYKKIIRTPDGIWSEKVGEVLEKVQNRSVTAQKSSFARWGKIEQKQGGIDTDAMQMQCEADANQSQSQKDKGEGTFPP
jgi:uncharacterized protein YdaU (DUF1376 family)